MFSGLVVDIIEKMCDDLMYHLKTYPNQIFKLQMSYSLFIYIIHVNDSKSKIEKWYLIGVKYMLAW
jgi:hypothetical protein